jgi:hypothetical protein
LSFVYWGLLPMRPSSQPLSECWRTSATTTLPRWLFLRSGCFPLWVLTTPVAGPYGSPTGAIVVSRATGCHSDVGSLNLRHFHPSGVVLQYRSDYRAASGGS